MHTIMYATTGHAAPGRPPAPFLGSLDAYKLRYNAILQARAVVA